LSLRGGRPLNYEPSLTMALDESCRRQCRIMIETRTNAYQVRKNDFHEEAITVYFTVRQYGSQPHDSKLPDTVRELRTVCEELLHEHVIDEVLKPLAQAISTK
jgi:hypothetical protein